jgi:anti-sigma factor RsiW
MATRDDLMRLLDGELSAAEATRVRGSLSAEDKERLAAMEEVGSVLRKHLETKAAGARLDTWSAIEGKLEGAGDVVRPKRWVKPLAGLGAAVAIAAAALFFLWPQGPLAGGPSIESIDFGEESGMLFQMHDSNTTVIWQTTNEVEE